MKKKVSSKNKTYQNSDEPAWLYDYPNRCPVIYSEKDYDAFAEDFIENNSDLPVIKELINELGINGAKEKIKESLKSKHEKEKLSASFN